MTAIGSAADDGETDSTTIESTHIDAGTAWEPYIGILGKLPTSPVVDTRLNIDHISVMQSHVSNVVGESRVAFTENGVFTRAVDPANVATVTAWLDSDDFITYDVEKPGVIAVGWEKNVGTIINQPASGDRVDFRVGQRRDGSDLPKFEVDDGITMRGKTFSPDSLREQPDPLPRDDEMQSVLRTTGTDLRKILNRLNTFTDHVTFRSDPDSGGVMIEGEGASTTVEKVYDDSDAVVEADKVNSLNFTSDAVAGDESAYSVDYVRDFITGARKSALRDEFTVRFGDDTPVRIQRDLADNSMIRTTVAYRKP
jgi:hypothetical protein